MNKPPSAPTKRSRTLLALIDRIAASHHAVEIVSNNGRAVLMPADEYASWQETAYLFRSTKNARRLLDAYERTLTDSRARTRPHCSGAGRSRCPNR
ncbi:MULTISPECIES: type II toxin-antitoxin system Phd/YefM family antitoxin [Actinomyces]|uniref:type II toxin-antitoxin system Phd/YefM family antitoxin n=1 Tax=Actinomyces TaxID=1654 RepID=UPI00114D020D|nr:MULTISPECIES: type II toxin-antitoxin system prevent-host-death family antitoxin [Actinomyces]